MRITQNQIWDAMTARLQTSTLRLADAQERVVTGLRVNRPSDDPAASSRIIGLNAEVDRLAQYQKNAVEAQGRLELQRGSILMPDRKALEVLAAR